MGKQSKTVRTSTHYRASKPTGEAKTDDADFIFGWEGTSVEPLIDEAREIVDQVWPNTDTPDVLAGVWDDTPIMKAVLAALYRGIELGRDE